MEIIPELDGRIFKPLTDMVRLLPDEHVIMVYFDLLKTIFQNRKNQKDFYFYIDAFADEIKILKDKYHFTVVNELLQTISNSAINFLSLSLIKLS